MAENKMESNRDKFTMVSWEWYEFAISQGDECLRSYHQAIDSVTGKSLWLFAFLAGLLGSYLGFAATLLESKECWTQLQSSLFYSGALASLPTIVSLALCVMINWATDLPSIGTKPELLFYPDYLSEAHKDKLHLVSAYRRLIDLNTSIDRLAERNHLVAGRFNFALRLVFVAFGILAASFILLYLFGRVVG